MALSTNLDIRSYAAARNVRMRDIAEYLGLTPGAFSTMYMHHEQAPETKAKLKAVIREIAIEKGEKE